MTYFPLYPYHSDPLRILSPRRIIEQYQADPPEPPPSGEESRPQEQGGEPSEMPDNPPRPGQGADPQDGGGAAANTPAAPCPPATRIPDAAYWPNHPGARETDPPPPPPPGENLDDDDGGPCDPASSLHDWLVHHWQTLQSLEAAGRLPELAPPGAEASASAEPAAESAEDAAHVERVESRYVAPRDRWTKWKMAQFLRQLAATHSVAVAARSVGMSRSSAYRLRNRLKGQPFDIAWEAAFRHGYDNLAHAALDRALNGVEVPHYHHGELVGISRKYDERLTLGLLAMRNSVGAPMLGRFGAAAEYYGECWDQLLERIEKGAVDWSDEHGALSEQERNRLELPDSDRELALLIARNAPDERGSGRGGSTK